MNPRHCEYDSSAMAGLLGRLPRPPDRGLHPLRALQDEQLQQDEDLQRTTRRRRKTTQKLQSPGRRIKTTILFIVYHLQCVVHVTYETCEFRCQKKLSKKIFIA